MSGLFLSVALVAIPLACILTWLTIRGWMLDRAAAREIDTDTQRHYREEDERLRARAIAETRVIPAPVSDDTQPMDPPLRPLPPSLTHDPLTRPPRQRGPVIVNPERTPLFDELVRDVATQGTRVQVTGLPLATRAWGVRDHRGGHYCARERKKELPS